MTKGIGKKSIDMRQVKKAFNDLSGVSKDKKQNS